MRNRQETHLERSGSLLVRPCVNGGHGLIRVPIFRHLAARDIGGKGPRIDGCLKRLIAVGHGPHVVFVRMGHKHRFNLVTA